MSTAVGLRREVSLRYMHLKVLERLPLHYRCVNSIRKKSLYYT